VVDGLHVAWVTLNNPRQYNSYSTAMVKGVIAGFANASLDRSVVAVVFTGAGDRAFCTGGNTKEYAEYYSQRSHEYGEYMDLFNTKKITGVDVIDFIKYRQLIAEGHPMNEDLFEQVLGKPSDD